MNKKEAFIALVERLFEEVDLSEIDEDEIDVIAAIDYFNLIKSTDIIAKPSPNITKNGAKILDFMRKNKQRYNNIFTARDIGLGLSVSSRVISAAIRKLLEEGFVKRNEKKIKKEQQLVTYSLTNKGEKIEIDALIEFSSGIMTYTFRSGKTLV